MAALSDPDPSSAGSVAGASFPTVRRGFDPVAVRDFLRQVADELTRAQRDRERLIRELDAVRDAARQVAPVDLDEAMVAAKLGEEAARVLSTAHEAATQIRSRTEEASARLPREAEEDASRQRGDAEVEAARRRRETDDLCESELDAAKAEGREMVAEARAVRERIFTDLTRRRELAREQIEALHLARVRILESFRGAQRDLGSILDELEDELPDEADDELPPLDLPDTGPVPTTISTATLVLGEMDVPATIVARHLEPEVAPEPEPDAEAEVDADDEEEPEAVADATTAEVPAVAGEDEPEAEPQPETEPQPEAEPVAAEAEAETPSVDDLFARLRAAGTATVARRALEPDPQAAPPEAEASAVLTAVSEPADAEAATDAAGPITRRDVALASMRTKLSRQLKRVLADEQNEVLDRLRQRNPSMDADDVLGSPQAHGGTYREVAEDQLWAAAVAGAHAMSTVEGEELHAALEARSVLDRCLDTLTNELVVPLRARLIESLDAAGEDPAEAATLLRSTYREWKGRLDDLSGDLTRTAYGRAAYAVLAPGTPVCWVLDPSGPACPDAEDNVLAGAVPSGEPFPTGHRYAPAYRGCRCLLVVDPR